MIFNRYDSTQGRLGGDLVILRDENDKILSKVQLPDYNNISVSEPKYVRVDYHPTTIISQHTTSLISEATTKIMSSKIYNQTQITTVEDKLIIPEIREKQKIQQQQKIQNVTNNINLLDTQDKIEKIQKNTMTFNKNKSEELEDLFNSKKSDLTTNKRKIYYIKTKTNKKNFKIFILKFFIIITFLILISLLLYKMMY